MTAVLVFAIALLLAVLVSERAERSVLSTAVLYLVAGFIVSDGMFGIELPQENRPLLSWRNWRYSACSLPMACEWD